VIPEIVIPCAIPLLLLLSFLAFAARRLLTYLHLFQQEEYDDLRFLRWLVRSRAFDRRLSLGLLALLGLLLLSLWTGLLLLIWVAVVFFSPLLVSAACLAAAVFERDPRKIAKKSLAMTARAKRIYWTALGLITVVGIALTFAGNVGAWGAMEVGGAPLAWRGPSFDFDYDEARRQVTVIAMTFLCGSWLLWVAAVQLVPLLLVAANLLLARFEARVQRRYWNEAHAKLLRLNPVVIGVTGSYGKTSVKHILGHVLEAAGPTLITPGSVNTAMGIARVIRERLQPHHRYFVVEMGAYGIGSIARLCALTPPQIGIITAIGKAHYERFKSLDAVAQAKFELAEAVCANAGTVVVAADTLAFARPREFVERHRGIVLIVGDDAASDLAIAALRQEADGIVAAVRWRHQDYDLRAPLYGLHQGRNLALAFAAACTIGVAPEDVVASLRSAPQIAHRLEVKRQGGGAIIIDDAYNSNPVGFASALELLDRLRRPDGRRILVTPGMAELGSEHDAEHARIGRLAAEYVDVLVAVAPQRVASLAAAFRAAAPSRKVVSCATFADADRWLGSNLGVHDVVLIENDLPDLLERPLRL
jgi:UDP-N-acetylmuramoyl-tripeptide--D-alanyl-D-alanine ligase